MKNSALLVMAVADWAENDTYTTGSASVVVECGPNEMVWVEGDNDTGAFEGNAQRRSNFLGYMLYVYQFCETLARCIVYAWQYR